MCCWLHIGVGRDTVSILENFRCASLLSIEEKQERCLQFVDLILPIRDYKFILGYREILMPAPSLS